MTGTLVISLYAATISTSVFVWRIYEFYYDRISKFDIIIGVHGNQSGNFCVVRITNRSKQKRFIDRPFMTLSNGSNVENGRFSPFVNYTFPLAIEPGERIDFEFSYSVLREMNQQFDATQIKAIVTDTHGKEFKSKWTTIYI